MNEKEISKRKKINDYHNNTNISLVNRYVYFAVDKVANSTIKNALFEIEYLPVKKKVASLYDPRCSPLLSPYQLPEDIQRNVFAKDGGYFKFAFVRNPYSRLLSCYLDRILTTSSNPSRQFRKDIKNIHLTGSDISFTMFLETICKQKSPKQNSHWRDQSDDILFDMVPFDHIAKFENLWEEMAFISTQVFGKVHPLMEDRNINASPKKTDSDKKILEYYDQRLADMVYERFRADFENFGYARLTV